MVWKKGRSWGGGLVIPILGNGVSILFQYRNGTVNSRAERVGHPPSANRVQFSLQSHLVKLVCIFVVAITQQLQKIHERDTLVFGMLRVELSDHICVSAEVWP